VSLAEGGSGLPAENSSDATEVPAGPDEGSGPRTGATWGVLAAVVIAAILLLLAVTSCAPRVPDVRGLSEKDARHELSRAGYRTGTLSRVEVPGTPAGRVGEQVPKAGAYLARGRSVDLVVAIGTEMVTVPDVVGNDTPAAELVITRAGLEMDAAGEYSSAIPPGAVISQNPPPGARVRAGSDVVVVVSLGLEPAVAAGWGTSSSDRAGTIPDDTDADVGSADSTCTDTYPGARVWSSGGDIYIRLSPGGATRQLTSGAPWDTDPLLSPSAAYVVFKRAPKRNGRAADIGRVCLTTFESRIVEMPRSLHMTDGRVWYPDYTFAPSRTGTAPGSDWLVISQMYEYPYPPDEVTDPPINVRGRIVVCNVPMGSSWVAWNEQFFPIEGLSVSRSNRAGCVKVSADRIDGTTAVRDFNAHSGMYRR